MKFATSEVRVHLYMSYSQSLESTKFFCLQYSLRYLSTFERVVIVLGIFRSCLFMSGLSFSLFGLRNHQRHSCQGSDEAESEKIF